MECAALTGVIRQIGKRTRWFRVLILACVLFPTAHWISDASSATEKRIALVIGNAKYKDSPLVNPVNDAQDMAAALRSVGFQVIERTDASQKEMNRAITLFGESLSSDTVALFYYAGHGVQVKGKNYLIPVDAQITSESSIRAEAVDVDTVLDQLSASTLNVVILDACRNNPFERRFRSISGGLAQMDAPKGSLIAYATAPGKTAIDGTGRNGIYTQELLQQIRTPGLPLEAVLKNVRRSVARATNDQQIPWESSSLTGDFYFNSAVVPAAVASASRTTSADDRPASQQPSFQFTAEDELWKAAAQINTVSAYDAYLAEYPHGRYGSAARLRIASLRPAQSPQSAASMPPPAGDSTAELSRKGIAVSDAPAPPQKAEIDLAATGLKGQAIAASRPVASKGRPETAIAAAVPEPQKIETASLAPIQETAQKAAKIADSPLRLRDMTFSGDLTADPATGLPSGKGKIVWTNGEKFEGEIKDGQPNGQGVYTVKSGEFYSGTWLKGKQYGKGRLTWANGGYWEGEFKDDQRVLTGQMSIKLDIVFMTGLFTIEAETGVVSGTGKFTWANGDYFEGTQVRGVKQGKGSFTWANGQRYDGDWERDVPNGKGTIFFANGDRFEGDVREGEPHGQGVCFFKNGDVYKGAWFRSKKQGFGRMTWAGGDYWEGEFKADQPTDAGRHVAAGSASPLPAASGTGAPASRDKTEAPGKTDG